jgi:HlyD family secretion protein
LIVFLLNKNGSNGEQTIIVKTGDFINEVSASGKVIPISSVDLSIKNSGRIEQIYFSVDELTQKKQIVKRGTLIAQIDTKDALKNLHNSEISLEDAKLSLAKFELESSSENLSADLQKAYDDGFIAVSDAFIDLSPTITGLDDLLLSEDNVSDNTVRVSGQKALDYKDEAEKLYYKAKKAFDESTKKFRLLNRYSSREDIEKIINETYDTTRILMDAIKSAKNLVDYLAEDTNNASEYTSSKNTLYEYTNTINEHLSTLLTIKTDIKNSKDAFSSTDLDIQSLLLTIKQKENAVEEARNELSDYYIRAPFDGILTRIDAKVGEIAKANEALVSMMSLGAFQIESFIPEINIAQIKIGAEAKITLDAYGDEIIFPAKVISIDPAETIQDGVSTYKIKLEFTETDERIKSGMTANVIIVIFSKPNSLVIPEGVIYEKSYSDKEQISKKFVQVKTSKKEIKEVEVIIGNTSNLGQVEVISGLLDGDEIILNPLKK